MATAFGAATLAGVAAGQAGGVLQLALVLICLLALIALAPDSLRALAVAGTLGFVVGAVAGSMYAASEPEAVADLPPVISGRLTSDPRITAGGQYAELTWSASDGGQVSAPLILPATLDTGRGDRLTVHTDGEARDGLIVPDRVEVASFAGRVEKLRRSMRAGAARRILARAPGSNGSLALGLLIGDDSGLTEAERRDMRASGLSHITAVSGSNVAMVILIVAFLLRRLVGRSWLWVPPQLAAILFYVWLVGAQPPIVRAAIMGALALIAIGLGRPSHLFSLLFLAGGLMALHDPGVLGSLSFQLSFLSMLALGIVGVRIQRMEGRGRQIAAIIASPAAAALATAPLLALRFGAFSLGTVPANVLVAPVIAPATALAALTALCGDVPVVGALLGTLLWLVTGFVLEVARFVGRFPGAYWTFAPPSAGVVVLAYLVLACLAAPLVPEARLAAFRLRRWVEAQPAAAFSSASAGLALLWALASLAD